jgi:hypothetical protein
MPTELEYTLDPRAYPHVTITLGEGIIVNRRDKTRERIMPQSIQVELPNGNYVELGHIVNGYLNNMVYEDSLEMTETEVRKPGPVDEPATLIDEIPAYLRRQAE